MLNYWVNDNFLVVWIRRFLDTVSYFARVRRMDCPDQWGHFTVIQVCWGDISRLYISQITGGGHPWSLEMLSFETGKDIDRIEIVWSMTDFLDRWDIGVGDK